MQRKQEACLGRRGVRRNRLHRAKGFNRQRDRGVMVREHAPRSHGFAIVKADMKRRAIRRGRDLAAARPVVPDVDQRWSGMHVPDS